MDLKTISATLALLGSSAAVSGCDRKPPENQHKDASEIPVDGAKPAPNSGGDPSAAQAAGEGKCGEGKCGEGNCGGKPHADAAQPEHDDAVPAEAAQPENDPEQGDPPADPAPAPDNGAS